MLGNTSVNGPLNYLIGRKGSEAGDGPERWPACDALDCSLDRNPVGQGRPYDARASKGRLDFGHLAHDQQRASVYWGLQHQRQRPLLLNYHLIGRTTMGVRLTGAIEIEPFHNRGNTEIGPVNGNRDLRLPQGNGPAAYGRGGAASQFHGKQC